MSLRRFLRQERAVSTQRVRPIPVDVTEGDSNCYLTNNDATLADETSNRRQFYPQTGL